MPKKNRITSALSHNSLRELLDAAGVARFGGDETYVWVRDFSDDGWVVFDVSSETSSTSQRIAFTVTEEPPSVELTGEPEEVTVSTDFVPVGESRLQISGRILEALDDASDGGRVFAVQIIESGVSLNGRLYESEVLDAAAPLYEGVAAFDHHRTLEEHQTSTIVGLVGHYRNAEANATGIQADLHLLPSAVHVAEAFDASLTAQADGLPPLVGISHDALASKQTPTVVEGRNVIRVDQIDRVLSSDVVAQPSAGGHATRIVAGGTSGTTTQNPSEEDTAMERMKELIALRQSGELTDEESTELDGLLDDVGLDASMLAINDPAEEPAAEPAQEPAGEPVAVAESYDRGSIVGRGIVNTAVEGLPAKLAESVKNGLPRRFTEADLVARVSMAESLAGDVDRGSLLNGGRVTASASVGSEDHDKLLERLDATFEGKRFSEGAFKGFRDMYRAFNPGADLDGGNFPSMVLQECVTARGLLKDTRTVEGRVVEAHDSTTFSTALGDTLNRRLVAEYNAPDLSNHNRVVSTRKSVLDFRSQKAERIGGFGNIPVVAEGAVYTDPSNLAEDGEATYVLDKRGRTATITMEAIANDDLSVLTRIPRSLGRAAARTHNRYVWNLILANPLIYDGVAMFAAGHNNTSAVALGEAGLDAARVAMLRQAEAGSTEELGIEPAFIVVPPELRSLAIKLTQSAVAITANADATVPNTHQDLDSVVLPWLTDVNDWFAFADPRDVELVEMGYYRGNEEPELFVQDLGNVGSVFDTDEVTYKLRHIYAGTVVDFRGAYRGTVI